MWFFGLIVVLLIGAVAVVASGRWGAMGTAYDDRPDMTVPARQALTSVDIETARFAVGVRGYRMDEVDTLLERVAKEVAERDRRIADLERAVAPIVEAPDGHGFSSQPYDPAEFEDTGTQQPILVGGPDPVAQPAPAIPEETVQPADSAGSGQADVAASVAPDEDDEPETTELPRASQVAADEYERLQAEARAVLEAQSQPVTPRRVPAPHQQPPAQPEEEPDPAPAEPPVEPPTAHWTSQPQQPLQLQQPQAPQPPVQAQSQHWTSQPAEPTPDARTAAPHPQAEQQPQEQQHPQAQPQQQLQEQQQAQGQQAPGQQQAQGQPQERAQGPADGQQAEGQQGARQAGANGAAGDEGEEGWRFWPPADQQGEGAYQRPS
jgi:DivIVA domain-containing protein